ncbi:unannotated protein [freshwater metagenome]|uniref:Unannotated protein n=1 Tax=freshwater metagenome TaxID=449393 RepID=A0A6J7S6B5_9ZZZZ
MTSPVVGLTIGAYPPRVYICKSYNLLEELPEAAPLFWNLSKRRGSMSYAMSRTLSRPFDQVQGEVRQTLADHGFGVITEINMQDTLRTKIGVEIDHYVILGACNPTFAAQALSVEPEIGLLLPCNVVIRSTDQGTVVDFINPQMMTDLAASPEMRAIAEQVAVKLNAALAAL